jgi:ribosomal protein S18 acetylase RimI-like enzyme
VSCRLNTEGYPTILTAERSREGYIWSVFTHDVYRGNGVAKKLVAMAIEHLKVIECTSVVLHSCEAGKHLYAGVGFEAATEMSLNSSAQPVLRRRRQKAAKTERRRAG